MINITANYIPSKECFNWCQDASFEFEQIEELKHIWIVLTGILLLFCYFLASKFWHGLNLSTDDERIVFNFISYSPVIVMYLLIAFIVINLWF